jgi:hypothetical protein
MTRITTSDVSYFNFQHIKEENPANTQILSEDHWVSEGSHENIHVFVPCSTVHPRSSLL